MAVRGRKPKPSQEKKRTGNPGHRPINQDEPELTPALPECPAGFDDVARTEWQRVGILLVGAGVITLVDRGVLAAYCRSWSLFSEADREVQENGSMLVSAEAAVPYQSPWLHQLTAAAKAMVQYAAELGMTPSARSRVKAIAGKPAGALLEFLAGGQTKS